MRVGAALDEFCLRIDAETEIRLLRAKDADRLFSVVMRNRDHLAPWMTWMDRLVNSTDVHAFVRSAEREAHEQTSFKAGIWRGENLAGIIDLHDIHWTNGCASIGYWLDRGFTGQGLMTRAVQLLTEYAFDALGLHRIEIRVATQNYRSRRIPERLGFTFEGVLRQVQRLRGTYLDHALYSLLSDERV